MMALISRSVRHHGQKGCCLLCGFARRNKKRGSHYYPALQQPNGHEDHQTSSHPDVNINNLPIPSPCEYKKDLFYVVASGNDTKCKQRRFEMGIRKLSIFDGIPRILALPTCFAGDTMHQPLINISVLFLNLWCVQPDTHDQDRFSEWLWGVFVGDVWVAHGEAITRAARYLPTSFG